MMPDRRWSDHVPRVVSRARVRFAFFLGVLLGIWLAFAGSTAVKLMG